MSKQKKIVYDVIQNSHDHLTAEQIFLLAKKQIPSIAVGTVYRNLNNMVDNDEIRRLSIPHSPDKYDKTTKLHHHLICIKCKKLLDVQLQDFKGLIEEQIKKEIESYDINIYYICPECSKN